MKIIELRAQNIKRLTAVEIHPDGDLVVISGRNGQGKTSVLDSIMYALGGKSCIPERPVREGANVGVITLDLGDLKITRTMTPGGAATLHVEDAKGRKMSAPQGVLDKLVGRLSFDPMLFLRQRPKDQVETVRAVTGLDLSDIDAERIENYEQRTESRRIAKRMRALVDEIVHYDDAPDEEISVAAVSDELETAGKVCAKIDADIQRADSEDILIAAAERDIQDLHRKIKYLNDSIGEHKARRAKARNDAKIDRPDVQAIRDRLGNAEGINAKVRSNAKRADAMTTAENLDEDVAKLSKTIERLDKKRADAIAAADMPIKGLEFDDAGVTLDGIPFEQASSAEQLRTSVAMGIALNPELRVLLIRDGSLLDEDGLRMMAKMAAEADAQVWIERVGTADADGIVIEDGTNV